MTTMTHPLLTAPELPPRRIRPRWLVIAALVVAIVGGGTSALVYAETYQPWEPGYAHMSEGPGIKPLTDGTRDTALVVTASPGHLGWYAMTLEVRGGHAVRVLGQGPWDGPGNVKLRWEVKAHDLATSPDTATDRPVTVHPGQLLTLWLFVTRPDCTSGASVYATSVPLRWSAFGFHHTYDVTIAAGASDAVPLYLCYPAAALSHIDPGLQ